MLCLHLCSYNRVVTRQSLSVVYQVSLVMPTVNTRTPLYLYIYSTVWTSWKTNKLFSVKTDKDAEKFHYKPDNIWFHPKIGTGKAFIIIVFYICSVCTVCKILQVKKNLFKFKDIFTVCLKGQWGFRLHCFKFLQIFR